VIVVVVVVVVIVVVVLIVVVVVLIVVEVHAACLDVFVCQPLCRATANIVVVMAVEYLIGTKNCKKCQKKHNNKRNHI